MSIRQLWGPLRSSPGQNDLFPRCSASVVGRAASLQRLSLCSADMMGHLEYSASPIQSRGGEGAKGSRVSDPAGSSGG